MRKYALLQYHLYFLEILEENISPIVFQGFVKRKDYSLPEKVLNKTASRISCTLYPAIHHVAPFPSQRLRAYSSLNNFPRGNRIKVNTNVEDADAVINHYKTQSAYFYNETKLEG